MTKNILVPYDFTSFGSIAFEKAVEIAKKFDSKITLLTVLGNDIDTSGMDLARAQQVHDDEENKAKENLHKIKDSNKYDNVDISVRIIHDPSVIEGILAFAETQKIDLIVMGSHGRSGFKKLVLGSVASGIVTKSNCPVLIAKPSKS
ncbi:MAG: universal stress protein [Nitrosopumilus sp.]|nr:universal stress protein [Nitrosopumilus sp.]